MLGTRDPYVPCIMVPRQVPMESCDFSPTLYTFDTVVAKPAHVLRSTSSGKHAARGRQRGTAAAKAPRARPCRVRRTRSGRSGHAVDWLGTRQDGRRESGRVKSHGGCFFIGGRIRQDLDIIQCTPCPCRQIEKRGGLRRDFCLLIPQDWPAFPSDLQLCPTHESKSSSMAKPQSGMVAF